MLLLWCVSYAIVKSVEVCEYNTRWDLVSLLLSSCWHQRFVTKFLRVWTVLSAFKNSLNTHTHAYTFLPFKE